MRKIAVIIAATAAASTLFAAGCTSTEPTSHPDSRTVAPYTKRPQTPAGQPAPGATAGKPAPQPQAPPANPAPQTQVTTAPRAPQTQAPTVIVNPGPPANTDFSGTCEGQEFCGPQNPAPQQAPPVNTDFSGTCEGEEFCGVG